MSVRSTLAAILLAAAAVPVTAQSEATTGIIRGTVRGPDGTTVGGAHVLIQHGETGFTTSVETTAAGTFARTLLPLGSYELIVTKDEGGQMERLSGLTLRAGESLNLDIELKEVVTEEITVSTDAYGTAATEDVTTSQRLSDEVIEGLPVNGRNFFDLTLLTPGASLSQGPDGDELNISGQRGIFNNFIVDGADFNNSFFGEQRGGQRPAFTFNQDAIQEMVVINQGATAEFGRSAGGFVNVITSPARTSSRARCTPSANGTGSPPSIPPARPRNPTSAASSTASRSAVRSGGNGCSSSAPTTSRTGRKRSRPCGKSSVHPTSHGSTAS